MTRDDVQRLIDEGWAVLPVPRAEKGPRGESGWQKKAAARGYTADDFEDGGNVGVMPGKASGDRVDVDLDAPEAVAAGQLLLPQTDLIHGRAGKRASHWWFLCPDARKREYKDPLATDGAMLLEIRANSPIQTVVPPSVHTSGEPIQWERRGDPMTIDVATLEAAAAHVAIAALLARYWPERGARHSIALALGGFLGRYVDDPIVVEQIVRAAATIAGDDEVESRVRATRDTLDKLTGDARVTGAPTFRTVFPNGEKIAARILEWLGAGDDGVLEELNARYFIVDVGAQTVIGSEKTIEIDGRKETTFEFRTFEDFRKKLIKRRVKVGDKLKSLADYWLDHPKGRQFDRLVYAPPGSVVPVGARDLQGWRGFTVDPKPGDWSLNRAFIRDVVCDGDVAVFEWVLDWLAAMFREPGRHAETALALVGGQGWGKGHFADIICGRTFDARHYRLINNPDRVFGTFNDVLSGCCLLFLDEAGINDKALVDAAKGLITGHTLDINRKHIAVESGVPSMLHLVIASNDKNPVRIDNDDRRWCVLHLSNAVAKNTAYFGCLHAELSGGGRAAMLAELLARPYDWNRLRVPPETRAKRRAKRESWTPEQVFLAAMIETTPRADWANSRTGTRRVHKETTVTAFLDFRARANVRGECLDARRALAEVIREHVPDDFDFARSVKEGTEVSGQPKGGQKDFWTLPPYDVFRASFCAARGIEDAELTDPDAGENRVLDYDGPDPDDASRALAHAYRFYGQVVRGMLADPRTNEVDFCDAVLTTLGRAWRAFGDEARIGEAPLALLAEAFEGRPDARDNWLGADLVERARSGRDEAGFEVLLGRIASRAAGIVIEVGQHPDGTWWRNTRDAR